MVEHMYAWHFACVGVALDRVKWAFGFLIFKCLYDALMFICCFPPAVLLSVLNIFSAISGCWPFPFFFTSQVASAL